jgi:Sec-independent protein translocase protein TatA
MFQLAFLFESADFTEWIVLLAVTLIVMGPQRLPEMARKMGRWAETFRRAADEFKRQIMTMDEEVHKQEPDYMNYAMGEPDEHSGEGASEGGDGSTSVQQDNPIDSGSGETALPGMDPNIPPEYRDSYPSEGIPTPEQTDPHEESVVGVKTEGEKAP